MVAIVRLIFGFLINQPQIKPESMLGMTVNHTEKRCVLICLLMNAPRRPIKKRTLEKVNQINNFTPH